MLIVPDRVFLEILNSGTPAGLRIRLRAPGAATHLDRFNLEQLMTKLEPVSRQEINLPSPEPCGRILYEALFPGELRAIFQEIRTQAGTRGVRFNLALDPEVPSLNKIYWERLYHPTGGYWSPMSTARDIFFSRFLSLGRTWGIPLSPGPLRLLVAVASPYAQQHQNYVDVDQEQSAIAEIMEEYKTQIQVEYLPHPVTFNSLIKRLERIPQVDILYFVGHGMHRRSRSRFFRTGLPRPRGKPEIYACPCPANRSGEVMPCV